MTAVRPVPVHDSTAGIEPRPKDRHPPVGLVVAELLRAGSRHRLGRARSRLDQEVHALRSGYRCTAPNSGTALSEAQRIELSRQELASVASTGLWFETPAHPDAGAVGLPAGSAGRAHPVRAHRDRRRDPAHASCSPRRSRRLEHADVSAARKFVYGTWPGCIQGASRTARRCSRPSSSPRRSPIGCSARWSTTRTVHPLVRMVNRIHVVEEARHVRFAREEVERQMADHRPAWQRCCQQHGLGRRGGRVRHLVDHQPGRLRARWGIDAEVTGHEGRAEQPELRRDAAVDGREDHGVPGRAGHGHLVQQADLPNSSTCSKENAGTTGNSGPSDVALEL